MSVELVAAVKERDILKERVAEIDARAENSSGLLTLSESIERSRLSNDLHVAQQHVDRLTPAIDYIADTPAPTPTPTPEPRAASFFPPFPTDIPERVGPPYHHNLTLNEARAIMEYDSDPPEMIEITAFGSSERVFVAGPRSGQGPTYTSTTGATAYDDVVARLPRSKRHHY